jgi:predicted transcriptional regulator
MDIETIFTDSKWRILTELSQKSLSPTDLSEKTGTSLPNISTQLKLLEALEFVEKEKTDNFEKGQPRKIYSMKKEFAYLILGTKNAMGKKMFKLNHDSKFLFSSLLLDDASAVYVLIRLFIENEELFKTCTSFGYLGLKDNSFEIIMIHDDPSKTEPLKNKEIIRNETKYIINLHTHTKEVFFNGVKNKEPYFTSILKRVYILIDKGSFLSKIKKGET